ncbi:MAG: DUF2332 domain-containing protein [Phenylobacterium sp.]
MTEEPAVLQALLFQSRACRAMGSPLNGTLLEHAAQDWRDGGPVRDLLAPWADLDQQGQFDAATPLRLIGALHELALAGADPALSAAYEALDAEAVWTAARPAMIRHAARLAAFMSHEPQTNEVRRSICLLGGFLEIAKATGGLPLRCFEIAASAGLNLSWDRYRYRMGEATWGDADASVAMDTDWSGPPPATDAKVRVIERAACDRRPTDLTDPDQRRRLLAYIWADQTERLARIRAAIDVALANGVTVEAADAVDWTRARVAPQAGAATVLYHSVFWQYMPAASQLALTRLIAEMGGSATPDAPFAWLRMEPNPENMLVMQVRLTLWPDGAERVLAEVHPHGAWVRWAG